jgi:hypothetical protein
MTSHAIGVDHILHCGTEPVVQMRDEAEAIRPSRLYHYRCRMLLDQMIEGPRLFLTFQNWYKSLRRLTHR